MENLNMLILIPVFFVLLVVIYQAIASMPMFNAFGSCVLSICVTILCMIGMVHFLQDSSMSKSSLEVKEPFATILLPYAALALAILSVLILMWITRCYTGFRMRLMDHKVQRQIREAQREYLNTGKQKGTKAKNLHI